MSLSRYFKALSRLGFDTPKSRLSSSGLGLEASGLEFTSDLNVTRLMHFCLNVFNFRDLHLSIGWSNWVCKD